MKKIFNFISAIIALFILTTANGLGAENLSIRVISPISAIPGEEITYTVIYLNEGDTKASNVEITLNLPLSNYTYVSSMPEGTYSKTNNTLTWNKSTPGMESLESLGAEARTIHVTVKAGVKGGTPGFAFGFLPDGYFIDPNPATLTSSGTIKSDFNTVGTTSNTVNTTVSQFCDALLSIAHGEIKSSTNTTVVYLVQITNSGNIYNKFNLTATNYACPSLPFDPLSWRFLDFNGNPITQTGWIAPGESFLVLFEVSCPPGSNPGKFSCHTITAESIVCNSFQAVEHVTTEITTSQKEAMLLIAKMGSNNIVQSGDTLMYSIYCFNSNDAYAAAYRYTSFKHNLCKT